MPTLGIDIGAYQHAIAVCRDGESEAERPVLRISADRAGFDRLDALVAARGPIEPAVLE